MTEKRYKRYLSFVLDDYAKGSDRLMTIREVIPRLNELHEENQTLRKALQEYEESTNELFEENKKLRRINNDLLDKIE